MTASNESPHHTRRPHSLHWWLNAERSALASIARNTRYNTRLQQQLQRRLPQDLLGQWQLARLDAQLLCIVTENPVWATRLRYRRNALLQSAELILGRRPQQLQIRIQPTVSSLRPQPPPHLSATAADSLRRSANSMEPGPLREALLRLASRCPVR